MATTTLSQVVHGLPAATNRFHDDACLQRLLSRHLTQPALAFATPLLEAMGEASAGPLDELAAVADRHPPELHPCDRFGNRVDRIEFHPAYREMQRAAYGQHGIIANYYDEGARAILEEGREVVKFAQGYLFAQAEQGLYCPVCMTDGTAYLIEKYGQPEQRDRFLPHLTSRSLEQLWEGSMFLTERDGGSDVGACSTVAVPQPDGSYRLQGRKWFCSNASSELSMVLARPRGASPGTRGLGLFAMRRHTPDGELNGLMLERLKDKLGTRSMPTGELVIETARAEVVGQLERGFLQMTDMLNLSRLYNATASLAIVRRVTTEALRWCRQRRTFGAELVGYPMIRCGLAGMMTELEASLHLLFEVALRRGRELAGRADGRDNQLLRLLTPLLKYHTARLAVDLASQALELHGGNGYIEDWPVARMFRDAQVLPIWEGATNILVLDALRAVRKEKAHEAAFALLEEQAPDQVKAELGPLQETLEQLASDPGAPRARVWCDRLIEALQASLLAHNAGDGRSSIVAEQYLLRHFSPDRHSLDPHHLKHAADNLKRLIPTGD